MDTEIIINGVPFTQHPDIKFKTRQDDTDINKYRYNYINLVERMNAGEFSQINLYRTCIKEDLWFVLYFIVKPFSDEIGRSMVNHPFIIRACNEMQDGPKDFTLDIWAREHYKTSISIAETIQYQLNNPEHSTALFSYIAPKSKKVLRSIRSILQREQLLRDCFNDVLYANPEKESSLWSIDEGIVNKRKSNRQEPSIGAYGLTEGMPTGLHFERRIYDDIVTEDIAESPDIMESIKLKFDSSDNIGKEGGHHRVIGTYYHFNDPLIYIRDKKRTLEDGTEEPAYLLRMKPATEDGTSTGKPVLLSQKRLDNLKLTKTFKAQQLLDPSPKEDIKLNPDFFSPIDRQFMPKSLYKIMVIDQAGDLATAKNKAADSDSWAMGVFGVDLELDEIGQNNVYLLDAWISPATESEAVDQAARMYVNGGMVMLLGVEKVGLSTTHNQISRALLDKGRRILWGEMNGHTNGILLRPAGRNKKKFIESALEWPLNNGKLFYSTAVSTVYIDRIKTEMDKFGFWHDDGLNMMAYLYDILFNRHLERHQQAAPVRSVSEIMGDTVLMGKW